MILMSFNKLFFLGYDFLDRVFMFFLKVIKTVFFLIWTLVLLLAGFIITRVLGLILIITITIIFLCNFIIRVEVVILFWSYDDSSSMIIILVDT